MPSPCRSGIDDRRELALSSHVALRPEEICIMAKKAKKKSAKAAAKKSAPVKKAAKKTAPAKNTPAKKTTKRRSSALEGEGSYTATRNFDTSQQAFIRKNRGKIGKLGKDAEAALEGPEGASLRAAEKKAGA